MITPQLIPDEPYDLFHWSNMYNFQIEITEINWL